MQTPEDILDGAVIYIGWIFASIRSSFCTTWSPASCAPWRQQNAAVLPDPDQRPEHRHWIFCSRRSNGILGAALATDISCHLRRGQLRLPVAASLRCCICRKASSPSASARCPPDGHRRADGPAVQHHGPSAALSVGRQRAGHTAVAAVTAASKTMNLLTVLLESIGTAMAHLLGPEPGCRPDGPRA